jgi:hypothetical protein
MRPNMARCRWFDWAVVSVLAVTACGGDTDDAEPEVELAAEAADQPSGAATAPPSERSDGELTIERLCVPIESSVLAVVGADATTIHNDFYADRADRILDCGWEAAGSDRTVRVGFNGAPSDFMIDLSDGKQDLAEVDAPNVSASARTDLRASNGWTITIQNLGADATEDPAAIAEIANAALAAIDS